MAAVIEAALIGDSAHRQFCDIRKLAGTCNPEKIKAVSIGVLWETVWEQRQKYFGDIPDGLWRDEYLGNQSWRCQL